MLYRSTLIVYGVINVIGGVIGLVVGNSVQSLVVGGIAGGLLIWLGVLARTNPGMAFRAAAGLTVGLLGFWIYRTTQVAPEGKTMMPMMNIALAVVVLAILISGHFAKTRGNQGSKTTG